MKNITLSIDEEVLALGREYARQHKTSFNALVRTLVEQTVKKSSAQWVEDTFALMDAAEVNSEGKRWEREELHRV